MAARTDDPPQQLFGHLAAVPAGPLVESAAHTREVPGVFVGVEAIGKVLRSQDPGVVGQPSLGISPLVAVNQLPRRRHSKCGVVGVEGELVRVLGHVEQMGVGAAELVFAVDPESVVPDDPTAAGQSVLLLQHDLQLGRVLVSDGQPEGAVGLEHADDLGGPFTAPGQVSLAFQGVLIDVVVVPDVKRRVGERQIDRPVVDLFQPGDAVLVVDRVRSKSQCACSSVKVARRLTLFGLFRYQRSSYQDLAGEQASGPVSCSAAGP